MRPREGQDAIRGMQAKPANLERAAGFNHAVRVDNIPPAFSFLNRIKSGCKGLYWLLLTIYL